MSMRRFGHAFIVAEHDRRQQRVVHVDLKGEIARQFACDSLPLDLQLLPGGNVLVNMGLAIVELDAGFGEIWRYSTRKMAFFSCQKLANGNVMLGDTGEARIIEVSPEGRIMRALPFPVSADCTPHYNMFRLFRPLDEAGDRLLVACFHDRKIAEFSWDGRVHWQAPVEGTPYMTIRLPSGNTLVSLGPAGRIVEIDPAGAVVWRYDMWEDNRLERGWISGISLLGDGRMTYSDSKFDRLVEISRDREILGIFQNRDILLHPSTHIIVEN
jgi:hypothetical protein